MIQTIAGIFLQIETVGPEGHKLIWILLVFLIVFIIILLFSKRRWTKFFSSPGIRISAEKNRLYHPSTITLMVENQHKDNVVIQSVTFSFRSFTRKRSFHITRVGGKKIYPLFLEAGKKHQVVFSLDPFFTKFPELKKMALLRVKINNENGKSFSTRYLLLKPTLFFNEK